MFMKKYKRKNIFILLVVFICSLGIGFAFLRTELKINGIATVNDTRWDIHFANLVVNPDSVELSTGDSLATISSSTTEVAYAITLKEPGDFYEFTVDAVNAGTIDAMIDTISSKMGGVEIETLPAYMEYSVTYSDGVPLEKNQYLKAGEIKTYKVHIGFKKDINASDLTGQVESNNLSFRVAYVQADSNAVEKLSLFEYHDWGTIINNIKSTNSCGPYNLGDTKPIGSRTLRLSNCSRPAECDTEGFSQTACGVVLEFADIITHHRMNSNETNVGGWPASEIRTFVNNDIYNALATVVKDNIIDTTVVSGHGKTTTETNFISIDKLYLLSTHEIWEDDDGNPNDGIDMFDTAYFNTRQLDYYASLNATTSNPSGATKLSQGLESWWWTRSVTSPNFYSFHAVMDEGSWGYIPAHYLRGVSPAFRLA